MPTQIAHKIQAPVPRRPIGCNSGFKLIQLPLDCSDLISVCVLKSRPWSIGSTISYKLRSHVPRVRKLSLKFGLKHLGSFKDPDSGLPGDTPLISRQGRGKRKRDEFAILFQTIIVKKNMNPVAAACPVVKWRRSFAPKLDLRIIRLNFYLICLPILGRRYGEKSTLFQSQFKVTFTPLPDIKGDFISCPRVKTLTCQSTPQGVRSNNNILHLQH